MFNLKEEDIIMKILVTKSISNNDVISNLIGNSLTPAGGDIANRVEITLTKDALYLQYKGHVSIGYAEEVRKESKINLRELIDFSVASKGNEELINIKSIDESLMFTRDNSINDCFGLTMSKIIEEMR